MTLNKINHIVATGSVDGILTTAALLRVIGNPEVGVEFTQAFQVDKLDPTKWESGRQVAFVDLAVNNQDAEMTENFVQRVRDAGHEIVAVADEHDAKAWGRIINPETLLIAPVSQKEGDIKSSGALLLSVFGDEVDQQTRELCEAADAGDRMDFSTHFGELANQAVKSAIWDNSRRVYLAQYFAEKREADEKILGWIAEYEEILRTHDEVFANREDLGDGIIRIDCTGKVVDMTTLMGQVYDLPDVKICLVRGQMFNKLAGKKEVMASFGTRIKDFDVLSAIKDTKVPATGFASKANVPLKNETEAIEAVRRALSQPLSKS